MGVKTAYGWYICKRNNNSMPWLGCNFIFSVKKPAFEFLMITSWHNSSLWWVCWYSLPPITIYVDIAGVHICIRLELLLWKCWRTNSRYVSLKSFSLILGLFFVKILHFYWLLVPSLKMASIKYYWLLCYKGFQKQYRPILFVKPLHLVFTAICFKLFLESSKA